MCPVGTLGHPATGQWLLLLIRRHTEHRSVRLTRSTALSFTAWWAASVLRSQFDAKIVLSIKASPKTLLSATPWVSTGHLCQGAKAFPNTVVRAFISLRKTGQGCNTSPCPPGRRPGAAGAAPLAELAGSRSQVSCGSHPEQIPSPPPACRPLASALGGFGRAGQWRTHWLTSHSWPLSTSLRGLRLTHPGED